MARLLLCAVRTPARAFRAPSPVLEKKYDVVQKDFGAGGVAVDGLVETIGPVDLLLVCVGLVLSGASLAWAIERMLDPAPRVRVRTAQSSSASAFEGAREVLRSRYLLWIVGIVMAYEFLRRPARTSRSTWCSSAPSAARSKWPRCMGEWAGS